MTPTPSSLAPCDHDECGPTGCRLPATVAHPTGHGSEHERTYVNPPPKIVWNGEPWMLGKGNTPTGIEAVVCGDIADRQAKGIAKYGVTVADNPLTLREWLQHAYEECLDQAVYLRRAIAEIDEQPKEDVR